MPARAYLVVGVLGLAVGLFVVIGSVQPTAAQSMSVDLSQGEFVFNPSEITVPAGTITFNLTNTDTRRHNLVISVNGAETGGADANTVQPGDSLSWDVTLDQPGTYDFWCGVGNHRERGMVGKITVQ
ncbi:MAG TPA: plastocyanin/azurin family copper-binding protein [Chloroflexota bacterium]|nr:plastocyanin/azurin family copper-binding protein [Chloroflexota bacterium]